MKPAASIPPPALTPYQLVEQQYEELEQMRQNNQLTMAQYRERVSQLRMKDRNGRLWMIQEQTGQWHVYDGKNWNIANPSDHH